MKLTYKGLENFDCDKVLIRKTVMDAIDRCKDKMVDLIPEIKESERIFLYGSTDVYKHCKVTNKDNVECEVWVFPFEFAYKMVFNPKERTFTFTQNNNTKDANDIKNFAWWTFFEELFLQFAQVEIKNLKPNRQIYEGVNCIYNNKTKSDIQIIDSTYFTTLIKSDAFKVRGHFRIQPYKEGKKIIWISDFTKLGYTRKAKIESK